MLLSLMAGGSVLAGSYWVSPNGTASWANAQSASPLSGTNCASLTTANANLEAGDIANLRGGTYNTHVFPGNSGASNSPITYLAYSGETPVVANDATTYASYYHALALIGRSWIKVHGITFQVVPSVGTYKSRLLMITGGGSYNDIGSCIFDGQYVPAAVMIWDGGTTPHPTGTPCVHNWIHGCTIKNTGYLAYSSYVNDEGGMQIGVPSYDSESNNNTVEGCTFFGGGHHNLETFTKFNVIRSNFFHFAGSITNNTGFPAQKGPDENGLYGNRNIQIYDGYNSDGTFNLLEGNHFGTSGPPPDDDGGDSLTITSPKNIIRYNSIYNSQNNGVLFKMGFGSFSHTNRFYNNTLFRSGRYKNTNSLWQGALVRWYGGYTNYGTAVRNNLLYRYGGPKEITGGPADPGRFGTLVTNNWLTASGDPLFAATDSVPIDPTTRLDLRLKPASEAIDAAGPLTYAKGAATNSTTLIVEDALYFQDGSWGSVLAGHRPDVISIGNSGNRASIARIDYATQTISLASPLNWSDRDAVYLYARNDGTVVFVGPAPDLGAHESGASIQRTGNLRIK